MAEKNYAIEWYGYGLDENNEFVIKFMMHWIAFNWLYNGCGKGPERDRIIGFCLETENYERLSRYNPFDTTEFEVFSEKAVRRVERMQDTQSADSKDQEQDAKPARRARRGRPNNDDLVYRNLLEATGKIRVTNLLLAIYRVRCNLFHGSKSLQDERDLQLVYSSAVIMEGYMKASLRDDLLLD